VRVLIIRQPTGAVDGILLASYHLGESYDLPPTLANYLVARGLAVFEPSEGQSAFKQPNPQRTRHESSNGHVLIVDDDPSVRHAVRRWLEGWGYRVSQASNATEALEAMLAEAAPIVLVDIRMPGHDGFWLIKRLRAKWPRTAFIMATGDGDLDTVKKGREAGAVDYVLKPFGRELLRQALDRASAAVSMK
jgi:CheY-like chemotaxis protein